MKVKELRCPYCKAPITIIDVDLNKSKCEYCGSYFAIEKENETGLDKFFRAFREEQKKRDKYYNSEEYKKARMIQKAEDKEHNREVLFWIGVMIAFPVVILIILKIFGIE